MKAIVLVGGEGTRLRPLTLSIPKQMLPIVGLTMIERVLGHLAQHGVDEAVLSLGYLPDAFMRAFPDGLAAGVKLTYAIEPDPLDTAGAILFASQYTNIDDAFIVVNGDVLTDLDVTALVEFHHRCGAEGTIRLFPVPDPSAFGVVATDVEGRVTAFIEKPPLGEAPTNLINAGTYVLEPSVLERIPRGGKVSIERETFPAMVAEGRLWAMPDDAYWLDAGTPSAYLKAHRDLLDGSRGVPPCPGARLVVDGLWALGEPVLQGSVVGECFVESDVVVNRGATLESSALGEGAIIERGAVVTDSVLLAGARVARDARVADSIIGPGAVVGERCDVRPVSVVGAGVVLESGTHVDGGRVPE